MITYAGCTTHGVRHLLITAECLDAQADCLQLSAHLVELLNISPCPNQVFGHDFTRILQAMAVVVG